MEEGSLLLGPSGVRPCFWVVHWVACNGYYRWWGGVAEGSVCQGLVCFKHVLGFGGLFCFYLCLVSEKLINNGLKGLLWAWGREVFWQRGQCESWSGGG